MSCSTIAKTKIMKKKKDNKDKQNDKMCINLK